MKNVNHENEFCLSVFKEHTLNEEKKARKVVLEDLSTLGDVAVGGVLSSALNVVHKLIETRCSLCF